MAKTKVVNGDTGANFGFEAKLWAAADALRNNMLEQTELLSEMWAVS